MVSKKINKKNMGNSIEKLNGVDEILTVSKFHFYLNKALDEQLEKRLDRALDKRDFATKSYVSEVMIEQRKEYERYIGALAEDFNDKFKSLGEGISMILERGAEDSEKNRKEHEWFKMKIARLEAKVF